MVDKIIKSNTIINITSHFKLVAGPGAGKTYWLVNNIKHLVCSSNKLGKAGRIACITYTNVGVDTIKSRIGDIILKKIEVSTLHSFFYAHIVKPYLNLIAEEEGFNMTLYKGLDSKFCFDYSTLSSLKKESSQNYVDDDCIKSAIKSSLWKIKDGKLVCEPPRKIYCREGYALKQEIYMLYKRKAWAKGILHYDDIHYFSYKILKKYPYLYKVLTCQFPYIFIDEFQDSTPIQIEIIQMLGNVGSIIGIIGDPAQSIYAFTGANVESIKNFYLTNIQNYVILENRRSTKTIINLLNIIRTEIKQLPINCTERGSHPSILVGSILSCFEKASSLAQGNVAALAYSNLETNSLKEMTIEIPNDKKLFDNFNDSDETRKEFITSYVKALEHARYGKFKYAFDILSRIGLNKNDYVKDMQKMLIDYNEIAKMTLYEFYKYLVNTLNHKLSKIKQNTHIYDFYMGHKYRDLSLCINYDDDDSSKRTIHKSKGDEFDNVMVCMSKEDNLNIFFDPNLLIQNNEWQRVYYVAISRARKRLFISIPSLSIKMEKSLGKLGFKIYDLRNESLI